MFGIFALVVYSIGYVACAWMMMPVEPHHGVPPHPHVRSPREPHVWMGRILGAF